MSDGIQLWTKNKTDQYSIMESILWEKNSLFAQGIYEREEEQMSDGDKTLSKTQEKQNKLIFHHGKYSGKL